jgi:hypothetical protein
MKRFLINLCLTLALLAPNGWPSDQESKKPIHLRDTVEIKHGTILLADLLPPNAPMTVRKASASVELGRAPQPGSVRILQAEQIIAALKTRPDLLSEVMPPAIVTIRAIGWPISAADVGQAISEFVRMHGSAAALPQAVRWDLPEFLTARKERVQLQVTRMQWDASERGLEARLRCVDRSSCADFVVRAIWPDFEQWPHDPGRLISSSALPENNAPSQGGRLILRTGNPATLILDDPDLRISLPVVCLEKGVLNQRIRVLDKQSRRVFLAEIVGDHLLHASL